MKKYGLLWLLWLGCSVLSAQVPDSLAEKVDALMQQWDRRDSPGAAIGVVYRGELIFAKGYGQANLDYGIPLTPQSAFYIPSTTKQFTAACIALLAQEGKLDLDDDVRRFLPEFPDYGDTVTIRHLVHHTSGVRDYLGMMWLAGKNYQDQFDNASALALICRQEALSFTPGSRYSYSNSGYVMLAEIIARASGQSARSYAQEHIFGPLGMEHTFFNDDHNRVIPNRVISYQPDAEYGFKRLVQNFDAFGDGNLISTVEDFYQWDQNFYSGKVGGPAFLQLMHQRGVLTNGDTLDYAFGLQHGQYKGRATIAHGGSMLGFRTQLLRFPGEAFSVIVLANLAGFNPNRIAYQIADLFFPGAVDQPANPTRPVAEVEPPLSLPTDQLTAYAGRFYSRELDAWYTLHTEENKLFLVVGQRDPLEVQLLDKTTLRVPVFRMHGTLSEEGELIRFTLETGRASGILFIRDK